MSHGASTRLLHEKVFSLVLISLVILSRPRSLSFYRLRLRLEREFRVYNANRFLVLKRKRNVALRPSAPTKFAYIASLVGCSEALASCFCSGRTEWVCCAHQHSLARALKVCNSLRLCNFSRLLLSPNSSCCCWDGSCCLLLFHRSFFFLPLLLAEFCNLLLVDSACLFRNFFFGCRFVDKVS